MGNILKPIKNKDQQLSELAQQVAALDSSPLYKIRIENNYKPVFGEGNPDANIMFIGEAPGAQEAETGRPFVGRAGKHLDSLLRSIDLQRDDVYITNIIKDRPPDNRNPRVQEIEIYSPFLREQIAIIQPKIIATLGRFAMEFIFTLFQLPLNGKKIGEIHGTALHTFSELGETTIFPLYHPAAVFYNRKLEAALKTDFVILKKLAWSAGYL
ncbi:MAG: uracil-DNA glycosylase [Brevefilum sp.]|nr:uracil-DNA glycosylase [Brevefilum sp.]MDW7755697.1 uracil-DNA glycosylase [Brevefilum sp.]